MSTSLVPLVPVGRTRPADVDWSAQESTDDGWRVYPLAAPRAIPRPRGPLFRVALIGRLMRVGPDAELLWVGVQLRRDGSRPWAEIRWPADGSSLSVAYHRLPPAGDPAAQRALERAVAYVRTRGIPPGRPRLEDDDAGDWRGFAERAIALKADHPRWSWRRVARLLMGAENLEANEKALYRWRRRLEETERG